MNLTLNLTAATDAELGRAENAISQWLQSCREIANELHRQVRAETLRRMQEAEKAGTP